MRALVSGLLAAPRNFIFVAAMEGLIDYDSDIEIILMATQTVVIANASSFKYFAKQD
jgi:hypothetical protein